MPTYQSNWRRPKWKLAPRAVKAWACSVCGTHFRDKNDPNLAMCCVCPTCRGPSRRSEPGCRDCKRCAVVRDLAYIETNFERSKLNYAAMRARLNEIDAGNER